MNAASDPPAMGKRCARRSPSAGTSLTEALVVVCAASTLVSLAVAGVGDARDRIHAAGAARHLGALVQSARSHAIQSGRTTALRFTADGGGVVVRRFVDGNRNGVRADDIARGVDVSDGTAFVLGEQFPGVSFGLVAGATDVETGTGLSGAGVRVGSAGMLSFAPAGTSSSGTLYVRGRGDTQYAVRVLGGTGRVRVLRFDRPGSRWVSP